MGVDGWGGGGEGVLDVFAVFMLVKEANTFTGNV